MENRNNTEICLGRQDAGGGQMAFLNMRVPTLPASVQTHGTTVAWNQMTDFKTTK